MSIFNLYTESLKSKIYTPKILLLHEKGLNYVLKG